MFFKNLISEELKKGFTRKIYIGNIEEKRAGFKIETVYDSWSASPIARFYPRGAAIAVVYRIATHLFNFLASPHKGHKAKHSQKIPDVTQDPEVRWPCGIANWPELDLTTPYKEIMASAAHVSISSRLDNDTRGIPLFIVWTNGSGDLLVVKYSLITLLDRVLSAVILTVVTIY